MRRILRKREDGEGNRGCNMELSAVSVDHSCLPHMADSPRQGIASGMLVHVVIYPFHTEIKF